MTDTVIIETTPVEVQVIETPATSVVEIMGGAVGPPGHAGGTVESLPTNSVISTHKAVIIGAGGFVEYASADNISTASSVVGITIQSVNAGWPVNIKTAGDIDDSAWTWTAGLPIYLGLNGALTQDQNVGAVQLQLATAASTTKIIVGIKMPFIRG